MEEQIKVQLEAMLNVASDLMPKVAKSYKILYDSLVEQGFTEDQALDIVTKYNPMGR